MLITRVINALAHLGVPYAVVGGYAVALHGAIRGTVDLDLAIALDEHAYEQAELALQSIGLQPRLPVTAADVYLHRAEYIHERNLTAWSFVNPHNPLEVVDILITEDAYQLTTIEKRAFGIAIQVASIDDLIRMKRLSGRPQDLADIEALEKLR